MTTRAAPRWALSFADLCLLLLGFVLLVQAQRERPAALAAGIRAAFGAPAARTFDRAAAPLFEPGEAVLRPRARAEIAALLAGAGAAHVDSVGTDAGSRRFDRWELAAARAAAIARAAAAAGVPADAIDVSVAATRGGGQRLRITTGGARP